jgi:hypothetical protein
MSRTRLDSPPARIDVPDGNRSHNIQMARQLGLSEGTVRTHPENIYARLQVSNRTAAVARAFPDRFA